MSETSLAIFSRGSQLLAEANTIQKAKDLKDLALTAADWARRKGMGEEAVQYARSYALDAERKMGQMLIEAPKAKGTQGQLRGDVPKGARVGGDKSELPTKPQPPTLHALGLTKREAPKAKGELKRGPVVTPRNHGEPPPTLRDIGLTNREAPKAKGAKGNPGGRGAPIVRSQGVTTQPPTLREAPKNKGAKGVLPVSGNKREPVMDKTPTLRDIGLPRFVLFHPHVGE
jgi:hypothetical protein